MTTGIIVAAGKSERMGAGVDKAFLPLCNKPVLAWSLLAFERSSEINNIILVVRKEQIVAAQALCKMFGISKIFKVIAGGKSRSESVKLALGQCDIDVKYVIIHDGARPLVTKAMISSVAQAVPKGPVVVGKRITDTVKMVEKNSKIVSTVDRDKLYTVQTPQAFPIKDLKVAYEKRGKTEVTDDAQVIENAGGQVKIIETSEPNFKITTATDLQLVAAFLK
jgi:2-C-methyl-D-erythritol 4-phosphate cytidylyltransferase